MLSPFKLFSFFSGSGFLDLGFEHSNFEVVYTNEIYLPFLEAYQFARKCFEPIKSPLYGYSNQDICCLLMGQNAIKLSFSIKELRQKGEMIGFIGGPPCPDFSIGGKNKGHQGDRGKLSESYIQLICQQQPDFFVFENVKGLYKTQKHRLFFEKLKQSLNQYNYILTERMINAIEYGVPQDRDRIILIGFHSTFLKKLGFVFSEDVSTIPENQFPWLQHTRYDKEKLFSLSWPKTNTFLPHSNLPFPNSLPKDLTVEYWFNKNNTTHHPNAKHYFKPRAGLKKMQTIAEGDDSRKSYKRLHRWRYSPTACYGNNEVHLHPYQSRRISVAEALALQSMPKEFILPDMMSLTAMFKTIGNGVPYLAAKGIAETIIDFIQIPQHHRKKGNNDDPLW